MPLIEMKCKNCGSILKADKAKDIFICGQCGTMYMPEKASKTFSEGEHIHPATIYIQVDEDKMPEAILQRAYAFESIGLTERAKTCFAEMIDLYPLDWRGWWGLCKTSTISLSHSSKNLPETYHYCDPRAYEMAEAQCSDHSTKESIKNEYQEYWRKVVDRWLHLDAGFPCRPFDIWHKRSMDHWIPKFIEIDKTLEEARINAKRIMERRPTAFGITWRSRILNQYKSDLRYIASLVEDGQFLVRIATETGFEGTGKTWKVVGAIGKSIIICNNDTNDEHYYTLIAKYEYQ